MLQCTCSLKPVLYGVRSIGSTDAKAKLGPARGPARQIADRHYIAAGRPRVVTLGDSSMLFDVEL